MFDVASIVGAYLDDAGTSAALHDEADDCLTCASGSYAAAEGTATCSLCPAGRALSDNGVATENHDTLSDCLICSPGHVAPDAGSSQCRACPGETSENIS